MPDENLNPNDKQFRNPADDQEMVSFAVMPHDAKDVPGGGDVKMSDIKAASDHTASGGFWHGKTIYVIIGLVVLLGLGAAAYFLLWQSPTADPSNENPQNSSRLPKVYLQQYFNTQECVDMSSCGEEADPDTDGLNNYDEFVEQSDPTNADTDGDGLADGDEVNVYLTDPANKFTDRRPVAAEGGYTDGSQIKNDYDPLTPGLKMTDVRKQQIQTATQEHGLHEPTKTTMSNPVAAVPQSKTVTVFITNGKFDPPTISISANDTVVWLNKDAVTRQVMSSPHPAHTMLPDLASGLLGANQTYSYKFTKAGKFTYHDETAPTAIGTVEVK
jgi:plastocyanin